MYGNLEKKTSHVVSVPVIPGRSVYPQFPERTFLSHTKYCSHNGTMHPGMPLVKALKEGHEEVATPRLCATANFAVSFILGVMYDDKADAGGRSPRVR